MYICASTAPTFVAVGRRELCGQSEPTMFDSADITRVYKRFTNYQIRVNQMLFEIGVYRLQLILRSNSVS